MLTTHPFDDDKLREECGVFGVYNHGEAAAVAALGLHALQHRGQEAAGIVTFDGEHYHIQHAMGQVGDNFSSQSVIAKLKGHAAIGHVRYATSGDTVLRNVQPLFADFEFGGFALAHNGNLTNALMLRRQLVRRGCLFQSTTDTEVIVHLMATARSGFGDRPHGGSAAAGRGRLFADRPCQRHGDRRPRPAGRTSAGAGQGRRQQCALRESCALDIIGAEFVRDVEPGEMIVLDSSGVHSLRPFLPQNRRFCIFEYIYFARPDSVVEGQSALRGAEADRHGTGAGERRRCRCHHPGSRQRRAGGHRLCAESGIPFELGIIRNHYVGRTFIEPTDQIRNLGVKLKHNANRHMIEGKRVVLVDDSIVRGTTSIKIIEMVRRAGAKEVHMRISSPPTSHACFYGVDTPKKEKLLAA